MKVNPVNNSIKNTNFCALSKKAIEAHIEKNGIQEGTIEARRLKYLAEDQFKNKTYHVHYSEKSKKFYVATIYPIYSYNLNKDVPTKTTYYEKFSDKEYKSIYDAGEAACEYENMYPLEDISFYTDAIRYSV